MPTTGHTIFNIHEIYLKISNLEVLECTRYTVLVSPSNCAEGCTSCGHMLSTFGHGRPGQCRNPELAIPSSSTALHLEYNEQASNWVLPSTIDGVGRELANLLFNHISPPSCELTFVGDSTSHDSFMAALSGALTLGFRLGVCRWGVAITTLHPRHRHYLDTENSSLCSDQRVHGDEGGYAALHLPPDGPIPARCPRTLLRHYTTEWLSRKRDFAKTLMQHGGPSTIVVLNAGLAANKPVELARLLESEVRPLLELAVSVPPRQRPRLLWRETTPQHFASAGGTGLYADARAESRQLRCAPIHVNASTLRAASWRNLQFERWSRPWRLPPAGRGQVERWSRPWRLASSAHHVPAPPDGAADGTASAAHHVPPPDGAADGTAHGRDALEGLPGGTRPHRQQQQLWTAGNWSDGLPNAVHSLFEVVPLFEALLPRWDVHVAPDCTHFCYAPPLWEPLWRGVAVALDLANHSFPGRAVNHSSRARAAARAAGKDRKLPGTDIRMLPSGADRKLPGTDRKRDSHRPKGNYRYDDHAHQSNVSSMRAPEAASRTARPSAAAVSSTPSTAQQMFASCLPWCSARDAEHQKWCKCASCTFHKPTPLRQNGPCEHATLRVTSVR